MEPSSRRQFLKASLAGAGLLGVAPGLLAAAEAETAVRFRGSDLVPLGRTGIKVSPAPDRRHREGPRPRLLSHGASLVQQRAGRPEDESRHAR